MLILLKHFQNKSRFDIELDKTYPCMFSSMFLIKNHQQGHSLKNQNKNLEKNLKEFRRIFSKIKNELSSVTPVKHVYQIYLK